MTKALRLFLCFVFLILIGVDVVLGATVRINGVACLEPCAVDLTQALPAPPPVILPIPLALVRITQLRDWVETIFDTPSPKSTTPVAPIVGGQLDYDKSGKSLVVEYIRGQTIPLYFRDGDTLPRFIMSVMEHSTDPTRISASLPKVVTLY